MFAHATHSQIYWTYWHKSMAPIIAILVYDSRNQWHVVNHQYQIIFAFLMLQLRFPRTTLVQFLINEIKDFVIQKWTQIFTFYYRPQTKFAKVMFLRLSVSHSVHGGGGSGSGVGRSLQCILVQFNFNAYSLNSLQPISSDNLFCVENFSLIHDEWQTISHFYW